LKKTFAELDIGQIKASQLPRESWLPNKLAGILGNIPDYVQPPFQRSPKSRPGVLISGDRQTSPDNYQIIGLSGSTNSACSSNGQSRGGSAEKSPADSELETLNAQDEKIVNNLPDRQRVERGGLILILKREFLTLKKLKNLLIEIILRVPNMSLLIYF